MGWACGQNEWGEEVAKNGNEYEYMSSSWKTPKIMDGWCKEGLQKTNTCENLKQLTDGKDVWETLVMWSRGLIGSDRVKCKRLMFPAQLVYHDHQIFFNKDRIMNALEEFEIYIASNSKNPNYSAISCCLNQTGYTTQYWSTKVGMYWVRVR